MGQPSDQTVIEGSAATFGVTAVNAVGYQWQIKSAGGSFTDIAGATSATYTTSATVTSMTGTQYRVVVTGSTNSVTSSAVVLTSMTLVIAPTIIVQPPAIALTEGQSANFSVTATGTSLTYQWQVSIDNGIHWVHIDTATSATLNVTAVAVPDNGKRYRVVVRNAASSIASDAALLTVQAAPAVPFFTTQPANTSVTAGRSAMFSAMANGNPAPAIQWQVSTNGGSAWTDLPGAVAGSYAIAATTKADDGRQYRAVATNTAGSQTSMPALLTVEPAPVEPRFVTSPADVATTAPTGAAFTVATTGTPTPTLQWQVSTDGGTSWSNVTGATGATLSLATTTLVDSGKRFRAVATNTAGVVVSTVGTLTVTPGFTFSVHPADASISAGEAVSFTASAEGATAVQWQVSLDEGTTWQDIRWAMGTVLALPATAPWDAGKRFRAVATQGIRTIKSLPAKLSFHSIPATGLSLLAGQIGGFGSTDGRAGAARFNEPRGIAMAPNGDMVVADHLNSTIRRIRPDGGVTTLAGSPLASGSGDGTGAAAQFRKPHSVAVDGAGNVYVADDSAGLRKITPAGVVTTLAHGGGASALAVDGASNVYVANRSIRKLSPTGQFSVLVDEVTADLADPKGMAVDAAGNIYVSDTDNGRIRKITSAGVVSTVAGVKGDRQMVDGTAVEARFQAPKGIAVDAVGNLYVVEGLGAAVRKITPTGIVSTLAGGSGNHGLLDGMGRAAEFAWPSGIVVDAMGHLFVADTDMHRIRKITPAGDVSTFAGAPPTWSSVDSIGSLARFGERLSGGMGLAADTAGNIYVADSGSRSIRKVTPNGSVSTLPGQATAPDWLTGVNAPDDVDIDANGRLYVAQMFGHGFHTVNAGGIVYSLFPGVDRVAVDANGNVYTSSIQSILKTTPQGAVTLLPQVGRVGAVDAAGNLYISTGTTIEKISPAGVASTLAGLAGTKGAADGTCSSARFYDVGPMAFDSLGNLYVADNQTIRKLTPDCTVTTVLGMPGLQGVVLGSNGRLSHPKGLVMLDSKRMAIASENAVLLFTMP
ncbi:NHL domain-containing protein [Paucibacter sp. XJ19-41]|uniref:NHL domain-containing protein n=1 Tax=Paucibacter sp. XJ19-41 TaxID=2927824 RepID=UPI00234A279B|nr:hypothetical protein [Paucibacter sp. XJ19-41]